LHFSARHILRVSFKEIDFGGFDSVEVAQRAVAEWYTALNESGQILRIFE
jgi:hypothetical protein